MKKDMHDYRDAQRKNKIKAEIERIEITARNRYWTVHPNQAMIVPKSIFTKSELKKRDALKKKLRRL